MKTKEKIDMFDQERLNFLRAIKEATNFIIDKIANFEDELKKIWLKPKFVLKSNYVISLDRIGNLSLLKEVIKSLEEKEKSFKENLETLKKIKQEHKSYKERFENYQPSDQLEEWFLLDLIEQDFNISDILKDDQLNEKFKFLPKVQTIYIDPPFNTGDDFEYMDRFQDSIWLTLMENRLTLAREFLKDEGSLFLHLDDNANHYRKILLNKIFGEENYRNEIILAYRRWSAQSKQFQSSHDYLLWFSKSEELKWNQLYEKYVDEGAHYTEEDEKGKFRW